MMPSVFQELGIFFIGPLAVAAVLLHLFFRFRGTYLLHWTLSCAALGVFHGVTMLIVAGFLPIPLSILGGTAAYTSLALLLWGTLDVADRTAMKVRLAQRILAVAAAAGAATGAIPFLIA